MKFHIAFKNIFESISVRFLHMWFHIFPRMLPAAPPPKTEIYAGPLSKKNNTSIPRIIWSYWTGSEIPLVVQKCFKNWQHFAPNCTIHILCDQNLQEYIPVLPTILSTLEPPKRADWIRLELLRQYGGIWLDASIFLTTPLDWVFSQQQSSQADFIGFYLEKFTSMPQYPVVENWFMAAPPHSPLIENWSHEFTKEVIPRSGAAYISHLKEIGTYARNLQKIDGPEYLSMHLTLQYIIQKDPRYRLALQCAEEGPYFYHVRAKWKRRKLRNLLLFYSATEPIPALIKLRGCDRRQWDSHLHNGAPLKTSLAAKYLKG